MTNIEQIKQLRGQTGAGVMECRQALELGEGRFEKALVILQQMADVAARKRSDQKPFEGKIEVYSHNNGRIGVVVEINVETEFASRSPVFTEFVHEIALHVAASSPLYVSDADIPAELLVELAEETVARALRAGKPAKTVEKIVAGTLEKYKERNVLLRQAYIRDEEITIAQLLSQKMAQIGETIMIRRFIRWEINPDDRNEPVAGG